MSKPGVEFLLGRSHNWAAYPILSLQKEHLSEGTEFSIFHEKLVVRNIGKLGAAVDLKGK